MARYIHCEACKNRMAATAKQYGEFYEFIEGVAKEDLLCDGGCLENVDTATKINKGDKCFAAVLLPNKEHFNYPVQKPEAWMGNFMQLSTINN